MSSAILYVAIVVIWAAVLIPRWLRRDPVVAVPEGEIEEEATMDTVAEELAPLPPAFPAPPLSVRRQEPARREAAREDVTREDVTRERRTRAVEDRGTQEDDRLVRADVRLNRDEAPDVDLQDDPGHRRVVKARKRMLLMLVALAIGAGLLAGAKMAAWWVIVPPAIMLAGYTLLLREAAAADRQRREELRVRRAEAATGPGPAPGGAGRGDRADRGEDHRHPVAAGAGIGVGRGDLRPVRRRQAARGGRLTALVAGWLAQVLRAPARGGPGVC